MAVVGSAHAIADGWSLSERWGSEHEFQVVYEVQVDSLADGPKIVRDAPGLPRLMDSYSAGNDNHPGSRCRAITFSRKGETMWRATCTFSPLSAGAAYINCEPVYGRDRYGVPTQEPLEEVLPFRTGSYKRMMAVEKAKNLSNIFGRPNFSDGPIVNSAREILSPGLEMEYAMLVVYVTARTLSIADGIIPDYINAVNEDQFELSKPGAQFLFLPYTVKCDDIGATLMIKNNTTFWEFNLTLVVDDIFTWRPQTLDRGFMARAVHGDPDGHGGFISTGDIPDGQPQLRVLTDFDGHPIQSPVLLDGFGQPLKPEDPPVYLEWSVLPEKSFGNLLELLKLVED